MSIEQLEAERKAFEVHLEQEIGIDDFSRFENGDYADVEAQSHWITWQAARSQAADDKCDRCVAIGEREAETRRIPDGDSCPGCEKPLSDVWSKPAAPRVVRKKDAERAIDAWNSVEPSVILRKHFEKDIVAMRAALESIVPTQTLTWQQMFDACEAFRVHVDVVRHDADPGDETDKAVRKAFEAAGKQPAQPSVPVGMVKEFAKAMRVQIDDPPLSWKPEMEFLLETLEQLIAAHDGKGE